MPEAGQNRPPQTRSRLATCLGSRDRFRRRRFCRIWCLREAHALAGWNTNSANCENVSRFGRGTGGGQVTTSAVRLQYFRPDSQGWRSGCREPASALVEDESVDLAGGSRNYRGLFRRARSGSACGCAGRWLLWNTHFGMKVELRSCRNRQESALRLRCDKRPTVRRKASMAAHTANTINNVEWTPRFTRRRSQVRVLSRPPLESITCPPTTRKTEYHGSESGWVIGGRTSNFRDPDPRHSISLRVRVINSLIPPKGR